MLKEDEVTEIRTLARDGMSIRKIASKIGISRNTVRKYLRGNAIAEVREHGPGRPRALGPYEDWLRRRVKAAAPIRLPATVLHREIAAMGFGGSERTVRRFVAGLYPTPPPEPVVRFETEPGHQAQMDWGEYRLGDQRVYSFVGVLGFSRWMYFEYVTSMRAEVLVECHRRMLGDFGGVPREILYDNMRTVVTRRDAYGRGRHRFHDEIREFANDVGFRPRLCRPYRPQTKGKVERAVDYIARSFFHPFVTRCEFEGRTPDLDELNVAARLWCADVANVRIHGTTKEVPRERLIVDQRAMMPYIPPQTVVTSDVRWPRHPLQRSPKCYDAVLQEAL